MARRRIAAPTDDLRDAIIADYRKRLTAPAVLPAFEWEPVRIGPTWTVDASSGRWQLPDRSLGWECFAFAGTWLRLGTRAWRYTDEQARFLLWWYALDESGRFLFRDAVLQRLKGWGKDPIGATVCLFELLGNARFAGWHGDEPEAMPVEDAWVQTAAVALDQTKNTMRLLPSLITDDAVRHFRLQVGKEIVYALGGRRIFEAITSSPAKVEGARSTFVLPNETHLWIETNDGHSMVEALDRNVTKAPDAAARTLRITNAYDPAADSVAQRDREAYEKILAGETVMSGMLYDSLEASPEAPLTEDAAPEVVRSVRGDSDWLNVERITSSIVDLRNPPSQSRRFWYNQITAAEDAWIAPAEWDACADGREVKLGESVVLFFDGSKSDDATGLVGCRVKDGHVITFGCWQRPRGLAEWTVPREEVDALVDHVHAHHKVKGFFADPGAGDDDRGERYWDALIDGWAERYGTRYAVHAVPRGDAQHPVMWDMRRSTHQELFTAACERTLAEILKKQLSHDGDLRLRDHVRNARRRPNRWGVSIGKEHRESSRKIDLAVCAIGARMVRRLLATRTATTRKRSGRVA